MKILGSFGQKKRNLRAVNPKPQETSGSWLCFGAKRISAS